LRFPRLSLLAALLPITLAAVGCASLPRNRADENVVKARQLSLRGADAMQRGRWSEAEVLLREAVRMCPMDERMLCQYAETLWNLGDHAQAVEHMESAARLSGDDPELVVQLGDMYLEQGDLQRAGEQAERAIAANRQLASAWALRGDVLQRRGMTDESLASYHRALSYQEHYPRVQLAVAAAYQQQARYRRMLSTLRNLADGYPAGAVPARVRFLEGLAQKELGRYEAANEAFLAAARQGEPWPELWYELAESRLLMGDTANARIAARAALTMAPQHVPSQQLLARLDTLQRNVALAPNSPVRY
jgi:tetratricopeptide (TPR) repeat protein